MPCIYAHDSFGKKVASKLPYHLQKLVSRYSKEFQIGLQGPDFLFFYQPYRKTKVNQLGYWQHKQTMNSFLSSLLPYLQKKKDDAVFAYLLGFICHFVLDSECHSLVIPLSEHPGYNHLAIENEFDRHLIANDGYKAPTFPVWKTISVSSSVINTIYRAYRPFHLSKKHIRKSLRSMRFIKHLLTCGCSPKRLMIRILMGATGHYRELEGHMMSLRPKKYACKTNKELKKRYDNAIPSAVKLIENFHQSVHQNTPLSKRFSTTFRENTILS